MERISIFNYEAFYLDHLEGNLSEEDTQMLLQFLEEHPECRMEDEELFVMDDAAPMTYSGKHNLKQVDESGPIGMDNVEHFMIADAEGLLDDTKKEELNAVVAENATLEQTRKRYNAVYYTPDTSVVFVGKSELKQRKALVLWPYLSGAVAAAAVVVIMLLPSNEIGTMPFLPKTQTNIGNGFAENNENSEGGGTTVTPVKEGETKVQESNVPAYYASEFVETTPKPIKKDVQKLNPRKIRPFGNKAEKLTPRPISGDVFANDIPVRNQSQSILSSHNQRREDLAQMENPIEPITKFINERAKSEVDFKRRKASGKKKGGFFLKIGKFEFSKNKH